MMFNLLPDAFRATRYEPWLLPEKYGDTFDNEKDKKKRDDHEAENKYNKDRMMHGKKKVGQSKDSKTYKEFLKGAKKTNLKPGEVRKLVNGKWVSNKK